MPSNSVNHYRRRKAQGLCVRCPRPAAPGFIHCQQHHERALADARYHAQRRKERGKWSECRADAVPGKSMCPIHREASRVSAAKQRTRRALGMPLTPTAPVAVDWGGGGAHGGQLHVVTFAQVWVM